MRLSKADMPFKSSGEKSTFHIYSNLEWEITVKDDSWCKIDPVSGKGNSMITVETLDNPEKVTRSTEVIVSSLLGTETIKINQGASFSYFPLLTIETENKQEINSKENYVNATLTIELRNHRGETTEKLYQGKTEIRGRGNSTWGMPKKPYRLKLDKSSELMDMPKSKHWVLLANYSDKTLMRNELAFEISRRMGYAYTPRTRYVDVVLNGSEVGNYMLCEHIRIDKNRVNIAEMSPKDADITGGYLLEIDEREGEPVYFKTREAHMTFCVSRPEDIPDNQKEYISNHIQKIEDILYGKSGEAVTDLPKYLDMKSFIDNFLINEVSKNVDGNLRLSTYCYKDRGDDKLYFGPVWDYDIAFGNHGSGFELTSGWYARNYRWYQKFFEYPEFAQMVKDRWAELRNTNVLTLNDFINSLAEEMTTSQRKNFSRWPILNTTVWPNPVVTGSYKGEVDYMRKWLNGRISWMDTQLK